MPRRVMKASELKLRSECVIRNSEGLIGVYIDTPSYQRYVRFMDRTPDVHISKVSGDDWEIIYPLPASQVPVYELGEPVGDWQELQPGEAVYVPDEGGKLRNGFVAHIDEELREVCWADPDHYPEGWTQSWSNDDERPVVYRSPYPMPPLPERVEKSPKEKVFEILAGLREDTITCEVAFERLGALMDASLLEKTNG